MSLSWKKLSLLQRQLVRGDRNAPLTVFRRHYHYNTYQGYPLAATLLSSTAGLDSPEERRRFSSDSSHASSGMKTAGRAEAALSNPQWLIPRKGTGREDRLERVLCYSGSRLISKSNPTVFVLAADRPTRS